MATQIEAAKLLVYHAAWLKDQGAEMLKEAAMAKLFASEVAMDVTTEAIQVFGGYGYVKEYDVERYFRDAKVLEIGEGTSEIQRIVISREIIKNVLNL
jgi:alkylation response protein AidB-like acyl-CoA dehydrogenase